MNLKKKTLFRVLEQSAVPLNVNQIRHRLGIRKRQRPKLQAILHELLVNDKIIERNGKYALAVVGSRPGFRKSEEGDTPLLQKKISHRITGLFSKSSQGYGFVDIGRGKDDIFVPKTRQLNAASGDRVEVELSRSRQASRQRGRIVKVIERHCKQFLARVIRGKRVNLAMPINEKSGLPPVVILPDHDLENAKSGDVVEVSLLDNDVNSKELFGKIVRVLPVNSVSDVAFDLILMENKIRTSFSSEALQQSENFGQQVRYNPKSGRRDLRALGFVTIDGQDARDFDDAVFVEKQRSGNFLLFVSIADVAHYVQPGSPIDQEAYQRGTSTYFPTHAIPMLPEALSNNLCSLKPKVNRLTLTCEMEVTPEGEIEDYSIYESVIRSQARLTYEEVADHLEGEKKPLQRNESISQLLEVMHELAQVLAKKRYQRGSIDFSFPEYVAELDKDRNIKGFRKNYQSVSMKLIEQFMLEANETVARHCLTNNLPALYRVHDKPDLSKLEKLQNTFWHFGISAKLSQLGSAKKINQVLQKIKDNPAQEQIQVLLLKSMALACYRITNDGHFGLAAEFYTHFTSPIRRYPDLIVHRALKAKLHRKYQETQIRTESVSSEVAAHLSQQERQADTAEKQSFELVKTIFMENYLGQSLPAKVMSVNSAGITVELEDLCIDCFLPLERLSDDYYRYDDVSLSLFGKQKKRIIRTGKRMLVTVARTDRILRQVDLQIAKWLEK